VISAQALGKAVPLGWQTELLKAGFAITHDKIVVIAVRRFRQLVVNPVGKQGVSTRSCRRFHCGALLWLRVEGRRPLFGVIWPNAAR
jgi:hypothetical protein